MSDFNSSKYTSSENTETTPTALSDASDAYANSGFVISFYHLMSKRTLKFKAYVTNYNEVYNSDFAQEQVFGRADPIYSFRSTTRQISLAFKMPASTTGEAYENLAKAQQLIQFLYPAYIKSENSTDLDNALTIAQTPLVRMKLMNLVGNANDITVQDSSQNSGVLYDNYGPPNSAESGLLGVLNNVTLMHNIENDQVGVFEKSNGVILPKLIEVSLNFSPIHEHAIGWLEEGFSNAAFPYGASLSTDGASATTQDGEVDPSNTNQSGVDEATGAVEALGGSGNYYI